MFLISPGSGMAARRLMVGMRQQDSPAAPVSPTLPQRRVSGSTAAFVNGKEQKPGLEKKGSSHPAQHSVRDNISCLKRSSSSAIWSLQPLPAAMLHFLTCSFTLWNSTPNSIMTNWLLKSIMYILSVWCKGWIRPFEWTADTADEHVILTWTADVRNN